VAIPFRSLKAKAPTRGTTWKANFLRRFRKHEVPEMYWSMVKASWYDLPRYGTLRFQ